jgi:hypothetical protein
MKSLTFWFINECGINETHYVKTEHAELKCIKLRKNLSCHSDLELLTSSLIRGSKWERCLNWVG